MPGSQRDPISESAGHRIDPLEPRLIVPQQQRLVRRGAGMTVLAFVENFQLAFLRIEIVPLPMV